jgi:hypothetical protein
MKHAKGRGSDVSRMTFILVFVSELVYDEDAAICRKSGSNAWQQWASVCRTRHCGHGTKQNHCAYVSK